MDGVIEVPLTAYAVKEVYGAVLAGEGVKIKGPLGEVRVSSEKVEEHSRLIEQFCQHLPDVFHWGFPVHGLWCTRHGERWAESALSVHQLVVLLLAAGCIAYVPLTSGGVGVQVIGGRS